MSDYIFTHWLLNTELKIIHILQIIYPKEEKTEFPLYFANRFEKTNGTEHIKEAKIKS